MFNVMLTRGGAVRWFRVTRGARSQASAATAPDGFDAAATGAELVAGAVFHRSGRRRPHAGLCRHPGLVAATGGARAAAVAGPPGHAAARRSARSGFRHRLAVRRHLVAVHQPAPLRRPAGLDGGNGHPGAELPAVALPGRGDGGVCALAKRAAGRRCLVVRCRLPARRTGARRHLHRLHLGSRRAMPMSTARWPGWHPSSAPTASAR